MLISNSENYGPRVTCLTCKAPRPKRHAAPKNQTVTKLAPNNMHCYFVLFGSSAATLDEKCVGMGMPAKRNDLPHPMDPVAALGISLLIIPPRPRRE
jgi:hypothetical protein